MKTLMEVSQLATQCSPLPHQESWNSQALPLGQDLRIPLAVAHPRHTRISKVISLFHSSIAPQTFSPCHQRLGTGCPALDVT